MERRKQVDEYRSAREREDEEQRLEELIRMQAEREMRQQQATFLISKYRDRVRRKEYFRINTWIYIINICGNFVAPLLLFSVISHCAFLRNRSYWSLVHGLLSDSAEPSLWLVRRLGMVFRLRCASGPLCSISRWP